MRSEPVQLLALREEQLLRLLLVTLKGSTLLLELGHPSNQLLEAGGVVPFLLVSQKLVD